MRTTIHTVIILECNFAGWLLAHVVHNYEETVAGRKMSFLSDVLVTKYYP